MALTDKQQAFIDKYLETKNATRAAIAAGYSPKTAYAIGWENLRKPEIDTVIRQRLDENAMLANEVASQLADMARSDIGDFLIQNEDSGAVTVDIDKAIKAKKTNLIKKLSQTHTIRHFGEDEIEETVSTTIELYDRQAALVQIGKIHKMFTEKQEITSSVSMASVVIYLPDNGRGDADQN